MTEEEVLVEINFKELIGTPFEEMIKIRRYKRGEAFFFKKLQEFGAYYLIEGRTQHVVYTAEGKEFYRNFFAGDLVAVNFSLANEIPEIISRPYDVDMIIREDSTLAFLPFERIIDLEIEDKLSILKKLLVVAVGDHFKEFNLLLNKSIYSDEEFFIKSLEKEGGFSNSTSRQLSERMNIHLRNLQRIIKKLVDEDLIIKDGDNIHIRDRGRLKKYMRKFKR